MKKIFSLFAAVLFAGSMMATVVTLNPSDFSAATSAASSANVNGVSAALTSGTITTDQIRIFKNQTITISSEKEISAIVFTCTAMADAQYGPGCFEAQTGYSYAGNIGTWQGNATSVAFKAASAQVRATLIEVYLDGETPTAKEYTKLTVAEAITAGQALDSMATSEDTYEVTGYVVNAAEYNTQYKNQIWFMADDKENTANQEFEAYACTAAENGTPMQVVNGDKVKLTGKITKYFDKDNNKYIIEIKNGIAEILEKAEGDHSIPEAKIDTITVAQAIEVAKALTPEKGKSAKTSKTYAVKGFIVNVKDAEKKTYYMADEAGAYGEFEAYRCASVDREVAEGDYVILTGIIQHYYGEGENGEYHSYEISGGKLVHAEAPQGIENIVMTEKAQKVVVDGVVYIVRDNKMFNLQGAQVR